LSNEKSPVGSVADAWMSPRSSLTTNVLPSRILMSLPVLVQVFFRRVGAVGAPLGSGAARGKTAAAGHQLPVAINRDGPAEHGCRRVDLAAGDYVEQSLMGQ
jgi:hypothetical protein